MTTYKLTGEGYVIRDGDTKVPTTPMSESNSDFIAYQAWLAAGNTPLPADPPSPDARMAAAKAARQASVDAIKVTTQAGHTFDGDEISQGRMARAIIALDAASQVNTTWVLSNNVPTVVSRAELVEALGLAGQEQTRLWMLPWGQQV